MLRLFQVNNLTLDFLSLQDGTAAMDYLENQEYQETLGYLVLGPLEKLGLLARKVHQANLGQKVFFSNKLYFVNREKISKKEMLSWCLSRSSF